jgi:hypothetical protein
MDNKLRIQPKANEHPTVGEGEAMEHFLLGDGATLVREGIQCLGASVVDNTPELPVQVYLEQPGNPSEFIFQPQSQRIYSPLR